jgi:2-polyprenyl-3-methyl-5-hydroxy-6-metoxy-1,4-benzoquinol methylase
MENKAIKNKHDIYYNREKTRIISYFPEGRHVILDLGCATGRLGINLKKENSATEVVGVEIFGPAAEEAAKHYNKVYSVDIESAELPYQNYFDFVVCGDILEHLKDPWEMARKIHGWLKNGGKLIVSIPNIRYWRIIRDLVFLGKWEYVDSGILDQTHLRFFTKREFVFLLEKANFKINRQDMVVNGLKQNIFNNMTLKIFEEFMGSQIIIEAEKIDK